jgi:hypothetical protein
MDTVGDGAHWLSRPKACIRLYSVVRLILRLRAAASLLPPCRASMSSSVARNRVSAQVAVGDVTGGAALGGCNHLGPQFREFPGQLCASRVRNAAGANPDGRGQVGEYEGC